MKFLLDSGDPQEYEELSKLLEEKNNTLWGSTTNPSLIAKKLSGKKISQKDLFGEQKKLVLEIIQLVPGAVSAEVYADSQTKASEMIAQGQEIATWHKRVVVKLPTTIEGFRARTQLRKEGVMTNNTLVFSQEQIFAICLHEKIIQQTYNPKTGEFPPFISPFVGRIDDKDIDGMQLVEYGMDIKKEFDFPLWMLEASVRRAEHIKRGFESQSELITVPPKILKEWSKLSEDEKWSLDPFSYSKGLKPMPQWKPSDKLKNIQTIEDFDAAIQTSTLDISHPLTDTGIERFAADWNALIA